MAVGKGNSRPSKAGSGPGDGPGPHDIRLCERELAKILKLKDNHLARAYSLLILSETANNYASSLKRADNPLRKTLEELAKACLDEIPSLLK
jgi:hypothetical protein